MDAQIAVTAPARPPLRRSVGLGVLVGVAVGLAVIGIAAAIIAIPFYALAQVEPQQGLDRPFIRDGLLSLALPGGILIGIVTGTLIGVWYARGGRLPTDDQSVAP